MGERASGRKVTRENEKTWMGDREEEWKRESVCFIL